MNSGLRALALLTLSLSCLPGPAAAHESDDPFPAAEPVANEPPAPTWTVSPATSTRPAIGLKVAPRSHASTAAWWIEGPAGVVLIDAQLDAQDADAAVDAAQQASGKKVVAALITHASPDKFGGTAALQARGVRVLTSAQVLQALPKVHEALAPPIGGEVVQDHPPAPQPESFGDSSRVLELAGLPLRLHVLGRGQSDAHVLVQAGDALFVGDLLSPAHHAALGQGYIDDWLKRLQDIRAIAPAVIHPGRGPAGGLDMIGRQVEYLRYVQFVVRAEKPWVAFDWQGRLNAQRRIEARYPARSHASLMREGLPGVWRVEAARMQPGKMALTPSVAR